jgi:hypothetical protein
MSRSRRFRASTLLVAVVLSTAPVFAGGHEPARTVREVHGILASLWEALSGFLPALSKGRSTIDPNGAPTDGRGTIDPNGATTDGRGTIDPDGATAAAAPSGGETDGRAGMDPNG